MRSYYQPPLPQIAQGDIFADVPSIYLPNSAITFPRRRDMKRGPGADLYILDDESRHPQARPFDPNGDEVIADIQMTYGILLTHACEMDNSRKANLAFALIRPMRPMPEEDRVRIRSGANLRVLHLPASDSAGLEESYVDFSRITSLRPQALDNMPRILSATSVLLTALYVGLARYFTRFDIDPDLLSDLVDQAIRETAGRTATL